MPALTGLRSAWRTDARQLPYVPQFGGYCAYGVSINKLLPVDITTWQVRDGKLYFNLNPAVRIKFDEDFEGNVARAHENWPGLVKKYGN